MKIWFGVLFFFTIHITERRKVNEGLSASFLDLWHTDANSAEIMMKSDKAVCTNDTIEEEALRYESVFSTLVENKVLAIKRECEERKKAKRRKRKSFGRIIFGGKKIFGSKKAERDTAEEEEDVATIASANSEKCKHEERPMTSGQKASSFFSSQNPQTSPTTNIAQVDTSFDSTVSNADNDPGSLPSDKNSSVGHIFTQNLVVKAVTHQDDHKMDEIQKSEVDSVLAYNVQPATNLDSIAVIEKVSDSCSVVSGLEHSNCHNTSTMADDNLTSIRDSIESLSFASSRGNASCTGHDNNLHMARRIRILEAKSISAQCSPILSRHKEIGDVQTKLQPISTHLVPLKLTVPLPSSQTKKYLQHQVSYPDSGITDPEVFRLISRQNTSEDSANLTVSTVLNEGDSASLHLYSSAVPLARQLSADRSKSKSTSLLVVSAATPNLSQSFRINNVIRIPPGNENFYHRDLLEVANNNNNLSSSSSSSCRARLDSLSTAKAIAHSSTTTTSNYFTAITTAPITLSKSTHTNVTAALMKTQLSRNGNDGGGGVATIDDFNGSGFAIVPSVNLIRDTAKLHRMTSTSTGSSVAPTGCCATTKSKEKEKRFKPSWPTGQSGSDDEYRKRKRKYKRYHRCSDPVLVYPSPSGLQHCILSMPPNEPVQFHYNEDFVYDVSLQIDSDKNDDLQEIVPSGRRRKHRHHKHKKRHRHKQPKILVHEFNTQSVKVIDPDELSQRARWTIIATAFFLLIMCLMLVGITLRMAPIIDDMVRQENERLMKESMERARLAKNFTDAASFAASVAEQIP